ncbi:MAG TPA: ABC transporter substrate-binding protein, partial [Mycobacterium sp.]
MNWRFPALAIAAATLFLLVLAPRGELKRDTIRVGIVGYLSFTPLFIAHEEGFFEAEGLEVEFLPLTGASAAIPALIDGEIEVLPAAIMPSYFNAINRGGLMRVVAGKGYFDPYGCAYSGIMARRSLLDAGELSSAPDLAGRRVSLDRSDPSYFKFDQFLKGSGVGWKDFEVVDIPPAARFDAFKRGTLDVSTASEPWVSRFVRSGYAGILASAGDFLPGFQFGYLLFGKNLLKNRREAGERFILAYLKAIRHLNAEGKSERHIEIVSKYTGLDKELLEEACWPSVRNDGRAQPASLDKFQHWAMEQGLVNTITPMDQLYDPSFIERANRLLAQ